MDLPVLNLMQSLLDMPKNEAGIFILAIFLSPLAVAMKLGFKAHFFINLAAFFLCPIILNIPHAWLVIAIHTIMKRQARIQQRPEDPLPQAVLVKASEPQDNPQTVLPMLPPSPPESTISFLDLDRRPSIITPVSPISVPETVTSYSEDDFLPVRLVISRQPSPLSRVSTMPSILDTLDELDEDTSRQDEYDALQEEKPSPPSLNDRPQIVIQSPEDALIEPIDEADGTSSEKVVESEDKESIKEPMPTREPLPILRKVSSEVMSLQEDLRMLSPQPAQSDSNSHAESLSRASMEHMEPELIGSIVPKAPIEPEIIDLIVSRIPTENLPVTQADDIAQHTSLEDLPKLPESPPSSSIHESEESGIGNPSALQESRREKVEVTKTTANANTGDPPVRKVEPEVSRPVTGHVDSKLPPKDIDKPSPATDTLSQHRVTFQDEISSAILQANEQPLQKQLLPTRAQSSESETLNDLDDSQIDSSITPPSGWRGTIPPPPTPSASSAKSTDSAPIGSDDLLGREPSPGFKPVEKSNQDKVLPLPSSSTTVPESIQSSSQEQDVVPLVAEQANHSDDALQPDHKDPEVSAAVASGIVDADPISPANVPLPLSRSSTTIRTMDPIDVLLPQSRNQISGEASNPSEVPLPPSQVSTGGLPGAFPEIRSTSLVGSSSG